MMYSTQTSLFAKKKPLSSVFANLPCLPTSLFRSESACTPVEIAIPFAPLYFTGDAAIVQSY